MRTVPTFSDFLSALRSRLTPAPCCVWCAERDATRTATAAHVAVAREGSLTEGDDLCATCGDALDEDALETEDVFAAVCDARQAAYLAALDALDEDIAADAALPWGPQWCEADALDAAVGVLA